VTTQLCCHHLVHFVEVIIQVDFLMWKSVKFSLLVYAIKSGKYDKLLLFVRPCWFCFKPRYDWLPKKYNLKIAEKNKNPEDVYLIIRFLWGGKLARSLLSLSLFLLFIYSLHSPPSSSFSFLLTNLYNYPVSSIKLNEQQQGQLIYLLLYFKKTNKLTHTHTQYCTLPMNQY